MVQFANRMNQLKGSEIRELLKLTTRPDIISFAGGLPAPELFPVEEMKAAAAAVMDEAGRQALQYSTTEGFPRLREQMKQVRYPSLAAHTETVLWDGGALDPDRAVCGLSIAAEGRFDSLLIEHTALQPRHRLPWKPLEEIGEYVVTYADGAEAFLPVTYAGNISHYGRRHHQPFDQKYYRHNGYTTAWETDGTEEIAANGEAATLYHVEWIHPRPDAAIAHIAYRPAEGADDIFVRRVIGICK